MHENNLQIEEVLAVDGYISGESLHALEDNHIEGYIPNLGQYKASRDCFIYDKENDHFTCSRGIHLTFKDSLLQVSVTGWKCTTVVQRTVLIVR